MKRVLALCAILCGCHAQRTIYVDVRESEALIESADEAAKRWNAAIGVNLLQVHVTDYPRAGYLDPSGIVLVTQERIRGKKGTKGSALPVGHAVRVVIENDVPTMFPGQMTWLLTHEFGHALGLQHSEIACNVMKPGWEPCKYLPELNLTAKQLRRVRALQALESVFMY